MGDKGARCLPRASGCWGSVGKSWGAGSQLGCRKRASCALCFHKEEHPNGGRRGYPVSWRQASFPLCPALVCPFEESRYWTLSTEVTLISAPAPACAPLLFPSCNMRWAPSYQQTPARLLEKCIAFVPASDGSGSLPVFVSGH